MDSHYAELRRRGPATVGRTSTPRQKAATALAAIESRNRLEAAAGIPARPAQIGPPR